MYENTQNAPWNIFADLRINANYNNDEMIKFMNSPLTYLNNIVLPLFNPKAHQPWTDIENKRLIKMSKENKSKINFVFLSLYLPGRSGKQLHSHYIDLSSKGLIEINPEINSEANANCHQFLFIDGTEKQIADEITEDVKKGVQISSKYVVRKATCYYYEPWNLAKRVAYQNFIENSKVIYQDDSQDFTEEFLSFVKEIQGIIDDINI